MAAIESAYKSSVSVKLNAGVNPSTGGVITKSCSLGNVAQGADADMVMDVVGALLPVLSYPLISVRRTEVTTLEL